MALSSRPVEGLPETTRGLLKAQRQTFHGEAANLSDKAHNGVHIATRQGTFADLTPQELAAFDLIVGADICFWEDLVDPLYQLVQHAVAGGVAEILVADPSRPPFDELCVRCEQQGDAEVFTWTTHTPVADTGRILRVVGAAARA